ncbi:hypothetical protein D3C80_955410 [compost metagenome]
MTTTNTETLFEAASRQKLRFDSKVGQLSVEDLWDLPLTSATKANLDQIAVDLNRQLKGTEESFVSTGKKNAVLELKFEIVKHIIGVRVAENQAKLDERTKAARKEQIETLIEEKKNEGLKAMSIEDLEKLAKDL